MFVQGFWHYLGWWLLWNLYSDLVLLHQFLAASDHLLTRIYVAANAWTRECWGQRKLFSSEKVQPNLNFLVPFPFSMSLIASVLWVVISSMHGIHSPYATESKQWQKASRNKPQTHLMLSVPFLELLQLSEHLCAAEPKKGSGGIISEESSLGETWKGDQFLFWFPFFPCS